MFPVCVDFYYNPSAAELKEGRINFLTLALSFSVSLNLEALRRNNGTGNPFSFRPRFAMTGMGFAPRNGGFCAFFRFRGGFAPAGATYFRTRPKVGKGRPKEPPDAAGGSSGHFPRGVKGACGPL